MKFWLTVSHRIDRMNERVGRITAWLALLMALVGAYNAVVRYLGRYLGASLSSNVYIELQWYLFSLLFLLGAGYTLLHGAHVRVDVLYQRGSPRVRAWIDIVGGVLFLIPFGVVTLFLTWPSVLRSWKILETSPDPGGLVRYPIRTAILLGFLLLVAQGLSEIVKRIAFLKGMGPADTIDEPAPDPHRPGSPEERR